MKREKAEELFRVLGNIDSQVIEGVERIEKKPAKVSTLPAYKKVNRLVLIAASVTFIALGLVGVINPSNEQEAESATSDGDQLHFDRFDRDEALQEEDAESFFAEESEALGAIPILLPSESGRQLVYSVDLVLQTTSFMSDVRLMLDTIGEMDGYSERVLIEGNSLHRLEIERSGSFIFRVPNEQLSDFLVFVEDNYHVVLLDKELMDFTTAYERNESNLTSLREQEQRLEERLENREGNVTQIESDLVEVRRQIRDLEEANTTIDRNVDYTTVTVRIDEVIFRGLTIGDYLPWVLVLGGGSLLVLVLLKKQEIVKESRLDL